MITIDALHELFASGYSTQLILKESVRLEVNNQSINSSVQGITCCSSTFSQKLHSVNTVDTVDTVNRADTVNTCNSTGPSCVIYFTVDTIDAVWNCTLINNGNEYRLKYHLEKQHINEVSTNDKHASVSSQNSNTVSIQELCIHTSSFQETIQQIIKYFDDIRTKYIEENSDLLDEIDDHSINTPITGDSSEFNDNYSDVLDRSFEPSFGGDVDSDDEAIQLQNQIEILNLLYGNDASQYLPGRIVKLKIHSEMIPEYILKLYEYQIEISNSNAGREFLISIEFPMSLHIGQDQRPPKIVQKKNGHALEEQFGNIARVYLEKHWQSDHSEDFLFIIPNNDPRLAQYKEFIHLVAEYNFQDQFDDVTLGIIEKYFRMYSKKEHIVALSLLGSAGNFTKFCTLLTIGGRDDFIDLLDSDALKPNLLLNLYTYLLLRIPHLTTTCAICDCYIDSSQVSLENHPRICTHFSCLYQYVNLGVCSSIPMAISPSTILMDLQCNPEVCDLLITLCFTTAISSRRDILFDPFPQQFVKNGDRDFDVVVKLLKRIPSVDKMCQASSESDLHSMLGDSCYQLLHFILSTKRKGILPLGEDRTISEFVTPHQYLLAVDEPKKKKTFQELKKKFGSYFAFHGTRAECLHSILRQGLVVASGTALQTTGSAYGSGMYFSPYSHTSMSFAKLSLFPDWSYSKFKSGAYQHLILCEIVKDPSVGNHVANPHHVIQSSDAVCTRLFFMYHSNLSPGNLAITPELEAKLRSIIPSE